MKPEEISFQFIHTFSMGDAGWLMDVTISGWYYELNGKMFITQSEDDASFDNPPLNWSDRIKEAVEDHFETKQIIWL
jgi:hypothetical protein